MLGLNSGRVAKSAQDIGLGDQFRYWRGASGRRYLFSLIRNPDLCDLQNGVVLEATMKGSEPVPVWLGEVDAEGTKRGFSIGQASSTKRRVFAHFLAGDDNARSAVMRDLVAASA